MIRNHGFEGARVNRGHSTQQSECVSVLSIENKERVHKSFLIAVYLFLSLSSIHLSVNSIVNEKRKLLYNLVDSSDQANFFLN